MTSFSACGRFNSNPIYNILKIKQIMEAKTQNVKVRIKANDLEKDMTIMAYIGFSEKYQALDQDTCVFLRHNFKGTNALIVRKNKRKVIGIERIQEGDCVQKIFDFPSSLSKLTVVSNKLKTALKKRGFYRFEVVHPASLSKNDQRELHHIIQLVKEQSRMPSRKQKRHVEAVRTTNEFVQQIKESAVVREEGKKTVENVMDNARRGNTNIAEIKQYVDNVTGSSSAEAMTAIVSLKASDQTYAHCIDVGVVFQTSYFKIIDRNLNKSAFSNKNQAMLGAFMHDFGKSKIPKDILDSTVRFERESSEMKIIEAHPVLGAKLLSGMGMPKSIINMAYCHHVKQDNQMISSYPKDCSYKYVSFETRLLSIIDVYQALVGTRKYKRSWTPPAAMRYLDALAGVEFDQEAWNSFVKVMGLYPIGSLVGLNDKTIGFVMNVPAEEEDMERPLIAVVRNAEGEDLQNHYLVDLLEEQDMLIDSDLDSQEVFGNNALKTFSEIQIS